MKVVFRSAQECPHDFFGILPEDWRLLIVPYWGVYKATSIIYVLERDNEVIAGGIVFTSASPDMTDFEKENAKIYFALGYLYIGFLWVSPAHRGERLGSTWLGRLKKQNKNQSFWLTIEEDGLKGFYEKNGFKCVAENSMEGGAEWLLVYRPK